MTKLLSALAVTAVILAATPVIAAEVSAETKTKVEQSEDGSMKKQSSAESTDAAGTTTKSEVKIEKDVDSSGSTDTTLTKEKSVDPKGLMNKTSTKVKEEVKVDAKTGKVKHKIKKVVDGKTVESKTTTSAPAETNTESAPEANQSTAAPASQSEQNQPKSSY